MHTCQIILVEADTVEEAFETIEASLSDGPEWSDWHNANNSRTLDFAGRWSGEVFPKGTPNYLQYSTDPALAEQVITTYLEQRMADISVYKSKAIDLSTFTYDPYTRDLSLDVWYVKKLAQILNDEWTCDSGLFDLTYYSANLANFLERVKNAPEKQWLIPVDFHF